WWCRCSVQSLTRILFSCAGSATTEISTLSLHDALPILAQAVVGEEGVAVVGPGVRLAGEAEEVVAVEAEAVVGDLVEVGQATAEDRKSTRLNSSHVKISYAVFCLKKKKKFACTQLGELR